MTDTNDPLAAERDWIHDCVDSCVDNGHTHSPWACIAAAIGAFETKAKLVGAAEHANAMYLGMYSLGESCRIAEAALAEKELR